MLITLVFDLNLWGLGFIITYGKIDHPKCRSLSLVLLSPFSPFLILASTVCFHFFPRFPIASFPQPRQYFVFLSFPSLKPINVSASSLSIRCPGISFSLISLSFVARFFWCGRQSWIPELKSEDRWKSDDCANLLFEDERSGAVTSARADTRPAAV